MPERLRLLRPAPAAPYESYPCTPGQGNLQRVAKVLREQMAAEE